MQIKEGESATLSWSTINAEQVTIATAADQPGETTTKSGSKVVSPGKTTEFILKAQGKGPAGKTAFARRTVTVMVPEIPQSPQIVVFEPDRRVLVRGDSTALHWETVHAARVELDDAVVNPRGDIKIRPEQTTTYRLNVFNEAGPADSRALTITVEDLPRDEIAEIQELLGMLGYDVGTADGLPGPRTRVAIEAFQNENGLTATGLPSRDLAERLRDLHRSVPDPEIVVFKSDRLKIKKGESLNLVWKTVNADRVSLNPLGKVVPSGERSVRPSANIEYELLAFNRVGRSVRDTIVIQVDVTLEIESLTVDRQRIGPDDKTTIRWRTAGAERVELMPFGEVSHSGSKMVSPGETTRYVLVATNAAGEKKSRPIAVEVGCVPTIDSFRAGSNKIDAGSETRLVWSTTCADNVYILPWSKKYLEPKGSIKIAPDKTTTYTLTALNSAGQETSKTATIAVQSASVTSRFLVLAGGGKELEDPRVIKAIQIGMPLQSLVEKLFGRSRKPRAFFEIPLGSKRVNADGLPYSSKNLERGKRLMAEAGFAGGMGAVLLYTKSTSDLAKVVSGIFSRIGIKVTARSVHPAKARRTVEAYIAKTAQPTFLLELKE